MRLIPSSGGSPTHQDSLPSAETGITACPVSADKLGLVPSGASSVFWLKPRATPRFALFHFQVITPRARRGKQSCQTCLRSADPSGSPGASTWGPVWVHSGSSLPSQVTMQIHPTRIWCKLIAKVSESFLRICASFCCVSGHQLPATGILGGLLLQVCSL